jgi:hypothetical protein
MVRGRDYPPDWAVLPHALVAVELDTRDWSKKPLIMIRGNREGLLSLGSLLVWISGASADTESLSVTALPFIEATSSLSLTVVQSLHDDETSGRIIRMDKAQQFQWLVHDELLRREATGIMDVAFCPDGYCCGHTHGDLDQDSDVDLYIERTDMR